MKLNNYKIKIKTLSLITGLLLMCSCQQNDASLYEELISSNLIANQLSKNKDPILFSFRSGHEVILSQWITPYELANQLKGTIERYEKLISSGNFKNKSLIICATRNYRSLDTNQRNYKKWNMFRGIWGIEFQYKNNKRKYCPTEMIAKNKKFERAFQDFSRKAKMKRSDLELGLYDVKVFQAEQYFVNLEQDIKISSLFRGNQIFPQQNVNSDTTILLAKNMASWLFQALHSDGRMTYSYFPSREEESKGNNMIRQFMATIALNKWANYKRDNRYLGEAAKNLRYNLKNFYKEDNNLGFIEYNNKRKLGAAALSALAIQTSSVAKEFREQEEKLNALIHFLWKEDGSFKTFYKSERNDVQNFYPGEALYYWSHRVETYNDKKLIPKIMQSFHYYKKWHMNNPNPAFIPWHTQAYFKIWKITKNPDLKEFIFKMNDWLINVMQSENNKFMDFEGRFYTSQQNYGPPHASATGVYIEGLADALELAKLSKDKQRISKYKTSIEKGIRSLNQLQFQDDIDTYYISDRSKVLGGIRTTVYHNVIRVDNVQHALLGIMKFLKLD